MLSKEARELGQQPAFPVPDRIAVNERHQGLVGLTKREYFAGLAMQGFAKNMAAKTVAGMDISPELMLAKIAAASADALLEELVKEEPNERN